MPCCQLRAPIRLNLSVRPHEEGCGQFWHCHFGRSGEPRCVLRFSSPQVQFWACFCLAGQLKRASHRASGVAKLYRARRSSISSLHRYSLQITVCSALMVGVAHIPGHRSLVCRAQQQRPRAQDVSLGFPVACGLTSRSSGPSARYAGFRPLTSGVDMTFTVK